MYRYICLIFISRFLILDFVTDCNNLLSWFNFCRQWTFSVFFFKRLNLNVLFRYNHIALGVFLASIFCLRTRRYSLGSLLFVLALNFKQMVLYHALPIFIFLLSRSFITKGSVFSSVIYRYFL